MASTSCACCGGVARRWEVPVPTASYELQEVVVSVDTDEAITISYLDAFYRRAPAGARPAWRIHVTFDGPPPGVVPMLDPYGVPIHQDGNDLHVFGDYPPVDTRLTVRKLARRCWLGSVIRDPFTIAHASAFHNDDHVILVAGDKRAGKTTLMLDAIANHGYRIITNDVLVVRDLTGGMVLSSTPSYVKIRPHVLARFRDVVEAGVRRHPYAARCLERYDTDPRHRDVEGDLLVPFVAFADAAFPSVTLPPGHDVHVVLATYDPGGPRVEPIPRAEAVDAMRPHISRWELMETMQRDYAPDGQALDRERFTEHGEHILTRLFEAASGWRFHHSEDLAPLLGAIAASEDVRRPTSGARSHEGVTS
jgi:hypothetical protein